MKKRTHTHTLILKFLLHVFTTSPLLWRLFLVLGPKSVHSHFFFPFLFFLRPHKILLSLSLSLSLFFIIASQKEARTQPRARKRREFTTRSAFFIARVLLVLYMPRYRMYFFLSQKQDKRTKAKRQKRKKEGGG